MRVGKDAVRRGTATIERNESGFLQSQASRKPIGTLQAEVGLAAVPRCAWGLRNGRAPNAFGRDDRQVGFQNRY